MSQSDSVVESAFASRPEDEVQYSSVSKLAVVALLLGLASSLSLLHPVMWTIPLAALVVSWFALKITAQPEYVGRGAVIVGMMLALIFGLFSTSRMAVERWMVRRHSRQLTDKWADLLADQQFVLAYEWTLNHVMRRRPNESILEYYGSSTAANDGLNAFKGRDEIKQIADLGEDVTVRFVSSGPIARSPFTHRCWNQYEFKNPAGESVSLIVQVNRSADPSQESEAHWSIRLFRNAESNDFSG